MTKDLEALQGAWEITELEMEGNRVVGAGFKGARITVQGDRFISTGMGADYEGTVVVDETQSPKTFDLQVTTGPEKGNTSYGIYELAGDTWRICLTTRGTERPSRFATAAGSGLALESLRRVAGADAAEPGSEIVCRDSAPEIEGEWKMVSGTRNGNALPKAAVLFTKRVALNGETAVSFGPKVAGRARFFVDRSQTPAAIDQLLPDGGVQQGIYELDGEILKMCFANPGRPRPTLFTSLPGDGLHVTEWKLLKR